MNTSIFNQLHRNKDKVRLPSFTVYMCSLASQLYSEKKSKIFSEIELKMKFFSILFLFCFLRSAVNIHYNNVQSLFFATFYYAPEKSQQPTTPLTRSVRLSVLQPHSDENLHFTDSLTPSLGSVTSDGQQTTAKPNSSSFPSSDLRSVTPASLPVGHYALGIRIFLLQDQSQSN